jgi:hypothetical protein
MALSYFRFNSKGAEEPSEKWLRRERNIDRVDRYYFYEGQGLCVGRPGG